METALLNNATPIHVRLTSMLDQGLSFNLRLTDFSAGGIAGLADREVVQQLATGPFWAEFELPGGHELLECVVRLVYRRAGPSADSTALGWAYCGGDDGTRQRHKLACIERFIAEQAKASRQSAEACLRTRRVTHVGHH